MEASDIGYEACKWGGPGIEEELRFDFLVATLFSSIKVCGQEGAQGCKELIWIGQCTYFVLGKILATIPGDSAHHMTDGTAEHTF